MSGVFRAIGCTLLLALCGTSMFLDRGMCVCAATYLLVVGPRLAHSLWRLVCPLGVRVAAAQSEDPLVDEGVVEEEEDADVEVEEEVGERVPCGWCGAVRCCKAPGCDDDYANLSIP